MRPLQSVADHTQHSAEIMELLSNNLEEYNELMAEAVQESIRASHEANVHASEFVLNS